MVSPFVTYSQTASKTMNKQIRARAEKERRRRIPATIDTDGQAYHRGEEIPLKDVHDLTAGDGYRAIDFRPPNEDSL